jgi:hypothetical protein
MNFIRGVSFAMLAVCLSAAKATADDAQSAPASAPTPAAPAAQLSAPSKPLPDLSKSIFSPAKNAIANGAPSGPSADNGKGAGPDLTPPQDLPGADTTTKVPDDNPMEQLDPDGVPLDVLTGHRDKANEALVEAYLRQRAAGQDKDWLLRSYEKAEQAREVKDNDTTPDLYSQLTANKELARLAGLPVDENADAAAAFRTSDSAKTNNDDNGTGGLRKDADTTAADEARKLTKPIIAIDSATAATNLAAPPPFAFSTSFDNIVPNVPVSAKVKEAEEVSILDTPGAISAKDKDSGDTLTDSTSTDLNIDSLPGESADSARMHQDINSTAELSLPMDSGQLHKDETAILQVPQPARPIEDNKVTEVGPLGPQAPLPGQEKPSDPNAPVPVSQVPMPSARAPISNPFDLLNR